MLSEVMKLKMILLSSSGMFDEGKEYANSNVFPFLESVLQMAKIYEKGIRNTKTRQLQKIGK